MTGGNDPECRRGVPVGRGRVGPRRARLDAGGVRAPATRCRAFAAARSASSGATGDALAFVRGGGRGRGRGARRGQRRRRSRSRCPRSPRSSAARRSATCRCRTPAAARASVTVEPDGRAGGAGPGRAPAGSWSGREAHRSRPGAYARLEWLTSRSSSRHRSPSDCGQPSISRARSRVRSRRSARSRIAGWAFFDVPAGPLLDTICAARGRGRPDPARRAPPDRPARRVARRDREPVVRVPRRRRGRARRGRPRAAPRTGACSSSTTTAATRSARCVDPDAPAVPRLEPARGPVPPGRRVQDPRPPLLLDVRSVEEAQAFLGEAFGERGDGGRGRAAPPAAGLERRRLPPLARRHRARGGSRARPGHRLTRRRHAADGSIARGAGARDPCYAPRAMSSRRATTTPYDDEDAGARPGRRRAAARDPTSARSGSPPPACSCRRAARRARRSSPTRSSSATRSRCRSWRPASPSSGIVLGDRGVHVDRRRRQRGPRGPRRGGVLHGAVRRAPGGRRAHVPRRRR